MARVCSRHSAPRRWASTSAPRPPTRPSRLHLALSDKGVSIGTTMPVEHPSQALACGDAAEEFDMDDVVVCAHDEDDDLLMVIVTGGGLDIAGAAKLTRQLLAVTADG